VDRKKPSRKAEPPSKRRVAWPRWTGFRGMTVRDWLQLLVVPLALVVIGFWFTMQQDARQQRIETQRAEAERELAEQRAQDEALQAYLDQMSTLLLERDLRLSTEKNATEDSKEARSLARARTLTVLSRLDPERKTQVMKFLAEAELIQTVEGREPVVVQPVVVLAGAELSGAKLYGAQLYGAELVGAELRGADLRGADLSGAYLSDAYLSGTNLRGANLSGVQGITNEDIAEQTSSLEGATMPNGQKY
jgi:cell division protein FtsB